MARRLFLVGFMGCGKSTVGHRLAARLGWQMVDTDREIERRAGMAITEIFATQGEERFRELEAGVVAAAARADIDTVIALGGGAVCREGTMQLLSESGTSVYLKMSPEVLVHRLSAFGRAKRPKIAGMDDTRLLDYIEKTLPPREMFYNMATFALNCDGITTDVVVEMLTQYTDNSNVK